MKKILITGSKSRFCKLLKKQFFGKNIFYTTKKQLNILNINSIEKAFKKIKPGILVHIAGLSRPMNLHDKNISDSIDKNIIGTCNLVKICKKYNVKIIYFSTNYVYPGKKGNYKEDDAVFPINNYALSKLAGECAVKMYKNSLILRICMTEKPFVHKHAFKDVFLNFMFHDRLANNLLKLINLKGILNVGGKSQTVYNFAKRYNSKIKKISAKKIFGKDYPLKQSMNISKFKKIAR